MTAPLTPADIAQGQLDAYNARDIARFVPWFSEDVQVFRLGESEPHLSGRAALETRYGTLFDEHPALHCVLEGRLVKGNVVVDRERVTGLQDDVVDALAIYEVAEGQIQRVWFG
jgi:hypothetical protein